MISLDRIIRLIVKTILGYSVFIFSFWIGLVGFMGFAGNTDFLQFVESGFDIKKNAIIGETSIKIQVADTPELREKGLSFKERMSPNDGMFFIFEKTDFHGIWMKDMIFSVDIIWIDEGMRVVYIEKNVSPSTYPTVFSPDVKSKFILEINSGFVTKNGIKKGDLITLF